MTKRPASQELSHNPLLAKKFSHLKISSHGDIPLAQTFALSILKDRALAQYVHHVTLDFTHWASYPAKAFPYAATTEAELEKERVFQAAIAEQNWDDSDAAELLARLMTTKSPGFNKPSSHQLLPDAVVALLLPILPNARTWTVGAVDYPRFVGKAVQRAKDGVYGSIAITNVVLKPDTRYSKAAWADYSFPAFKIFANLPILRSIEGKGIGGIGIEDGGRYYDIPSKASSVEEIRLRDCELSGGCLARIVDFSTGLKVLRYRFGGRSGDGGTGSIYSPQVARMLEPHRLTLVSLDLDIESLLDENLAKEIQTWQAGLKEEEEEEEEEDGGDSDTNTLNSSDSKAATQKERTEIGTTPYFPALTHLRIGIKLASRFAKLSGRETLAAWLPPRLEELEIVGYRAQDSEELATKVREVVERRAELLPNLKVLKGVDEYIEYGKELNNEDDYEKSEESDEE